MTVAWMERSGIREYRWHESPDSASFIRAICFAQYNIFNPL